MNYKKPLDLIQEKPYLFWYVKDKECLSDEAIVEAILNRGDFDDFLKLLDLMGIKRVAEIFYKQTLLKRTNYSKKTENYFRLFFERHLKHV
jgi:hypothetical protein